MVKVSEHVWLGQQLYQLGWMSPFKKDDSTAFAR